MVEFDEIVIFPGEKWRVWVKRSRAEIDGHGVLLHENSTGTENFGGVNAIDFGFRFYIFHLI